MMKGSIPLQSDSKVVFLKLWLLANTTYYYKDIVWISYEF
jgi:hypothetical protein